MLIPSVAGRAQEHHHLFGEITLPPPPHTFLHALSLKPLCPTQILFSFSHPHGTPGHLIPVILRVPTVPASTQLKLVAHISFLEPLQPVEGTISILCWAVLVTMFLIMERLLTVERSFVPSFRLSRDIESVRKNDSWAKVPKPMPHGRSVLGCIYSQIHQRS